jgi:hypothetical protein
MSSFISSFINRPSLAPGTDPNIEPRRIVRLEPLPTTIEVEDGTVLEVHLVVGSVKKRLNQLDQQGRPAYDVEVALRTLNVTKNAKNG